MKVGPTRGKCEKRVVLEEAIAFRYFNSNRVGTRCQSSDLLKFLQSELHIQNKSAGPIQLFPLHFLPLLCAYFLKNLFTISQFVLHNDYVISAERSFEQACLFYTFEKKSRRHEILLYHVFGAKYVKD